MSAQIEQIADVEESLLTYFGFNALRPGQDTVIAAVMAGRDALAIMPTGGGKSLCYQLPALCRTGLTLVVSPLIALMKDQVDALQARGIAAAAIHSGLGSDEYRQVMDDFTRGQLKILYVAPERFGQEGFMRTLQMQQIALMAIDEAHCLSQWGHDFRPDYLRLGRAREALGNPQTIALTATATAQVRDDVLASLQLNDPEVIIHGFSRENLDFGIVACESRRAKFERLATLIQLWRKGIIYCSTRKNVMAVFEAVQGHGATVVAYHAGMTDDEREFSQDAFISGRADVVVATNAFGMGIDRADVRFVAHFEVPGSVEAYYQEAGRAGRDGQKSVCELLFNHADLRTQEFFFEGSNPPVTLLRSLYNFLRTQRDPETNCVEMTVDAMADHMGKEANSMSLGTALSVLIHSKAIARYDIPGRLLKGTRVLEPSRNYQMLDIDEDKLEEKARRDHLKIESITRYAYSTLCRHQWILDYFGEEGASSCGHCDICSKRAPEDAQLIEGDDQKTVLKALSGVARASRRMADGSWEGIYGKGKIMDMLRGSKREGMHSGLTGLSTYGLLSNLKKTQIQALFSAMSEVGFLASNGGEMPLVTLTAKGFAVMMGREPLVMSARWKSSAAPAAPDRNRVNSGNRGKDVALAAIASMRMDKELYERLRELRADIADYNNIPVYRVLQTETMRRMAEEKPTCMAAAGEMKGVGPYVRENYLRSFVDLITDYVGK